MQDVNLELIITLVSIIGTVFAAFGFLHREMRRGFERVDRRFQDVDRKFEHMEANFGHMEAKFDDKLDRLEARFDRKFERLDKKFDGMRADVGALQVSVARIEGHLGLVAPAPSAPRASEPPERAA